MHSPPAANAVPAPSTPEEWEAQRTSEVRAQLKVFTRDMVFYRKRCCFLEEELAARDKALAFLCAELRAYATRPPEPPTVPALQSRAA